MAAERLSFPEHVLMTADAAGGVWTYAAELIPALGARGVRVSLAVLGPRATAEQRAFLAETNVEIYQRECKLEWMESPWADVESAGLWLLSLERSLKPDVVHLNGYAHAALPWSNPVLVVAHSCVLSWWQAVKGCPAPERWAEYRRRVADGLEAADLIVGVSGGMLAEVERLYGPSGDRRVIRNARSSGLFRATQGKARIILAAGRVWDGGKNIGILEKVAPELPWPVYVAGEERSPEGRTADLRNVRLLGRLAPVEMLGWFCRASIYVHPAYYEPFGLSVLEAALSRCALILSDIPSLREMWDGCALFVTPEDANALSGALRSLIASASLRGMLAARAYDRALGLNPNGMAEQYLEAYAAALRNRQATARRQEGRLCAS